MSFASWRRLNHSALLGTKHINGALIGQVHSLAHHVISHMTDLKYIMLSVMACTQYVSMAHHHISIVYECMAIREKGCTLCMFSESKVSAYWKTRLKFQVKAETSHLTMSSSVTHWEPSSLAGRLFDPTGVKPWPQEEQKLLITGPQSGWCCCYSSFPWFPLIALHFLSFPPPYSTR